MSDVDMDTSPQSSATSDVEKPPTPDYEDEDGDEHDDNFDEDEAIEKDVKEQASVKSKSPNESGNDESDEDVGEGSVSQHGSSLDENDVQENASVPQSDFVREASSPVTPSSARDESPGHQIPNELEEDDFKKDTGENVEKSDDTTLPEVVQNKDKVKGDVMSEVEESVTKEQDQTKEEDCVDRILHDNKSFSKTSASSGNVHVDDGDLLQMSDLSVDLTGDEAAIVEDILQSAGDGELIPSGNTAEEKPLLDDKEEVSDSAKKASAELTKEQQHNQQEEQGGGTGELFADIFGSSDEDEEFEGFEKEELQGSSRSKKKLSKEKHKKKPVIISDEEDEPTKTEEPEAEAEAEAEVEVEEPKESLVVPAPVSDSSGSEDEQPQCFISDFDLMMEQKKEENRKVRRRKNVDIINDSDDMVVGLIKRMQQAAQEDRLANEARQAATKKLILLPSVMKHMLKIDLMVVFLDCNVLPVLKEWIMPLPDGSLPHLQVREGVLKILKQLPTVDSGALKVSGIGKAVMYLFRHPKELRKNKECAGKLISEWSRPIFGVTANFKSMTREEREERDYANMTKRRRLSNDDRAGGKTPEKMESTINSASKGLRPGEKGWCMRARVPAPSNKDYVVRPKSDIDFVDFSKTSKKTLNRFEQQKRKFNEKKGSASKQRAVEISLEGRKMAL